MKREILFRGKRIDNGDFVAGDLMQHYIHHKGLTIVHGGCINYEVDPETIGQFTGLTDKNGVKIFEGDIINLLKDDEAVEENKELYFDNGAFVIHIDYDHIQVPIFDWHGPDANFSIEVIGNIHDNKELLNHERVH